MTQISFGDLAQSHLLRRQTVATKADILRLSQEVTTGRSADTAARVAGDLVPINAIDASLARLKGYGAVTRETALFATAMQSGLAVIDGLAAETGRAMLATTSTASTVQLDAAAKSARQGLETVLSTLNTRFGDRTLFAGTATNGAAIADVDVLMTALTTATAGANTVADVETALNNWFATPAGFAGTMYLGGAPLGSVPVAAGETAALDVTATDPAIKSTIKALAMAALLDRGLFAGEPAARMNLAERAGESLTAGQTERAALAARLGTTEAHIAAAETRNTSEASALEIARAAIVEVDPYEATTRLQDAESQLELIYALTARLSRLSLADYL